MQLSCRRCGKKIPPEDIDIQQVQARCRPCGEVFSFRAMVTEALLPPAARYTVATPRGYTLLHRGAELLITWRWLTRPMIHLLLLTLIWDAVLAGGYRWLFPGGISLENSPGLLICMPFLIVGIWLTGWTLCVFINRTTVRVNDTLLTVRHGPLPWIGNVRIPADDIDQLYCEEKAYFHMIIYSVIVLRKTGPRVKLFSKLRQMNQAAFIEQQVEQRLRIADRPIAGEMFWV